MFALVKHNLSFTDDYAAGVPAPSVGLTFQPHTDDLRDWPAPAEAAEELQN